MKRILGLDLGTASIGWAVVNVAENENETTGIAGCGSRVVPLTTDERDCFEKGKAITTNADRRLKRSMRRNLQRRKQRRDNLIERMRAEGWIDSTTPLSENGKGSTYDTIRLRAKAASEEISLQEFARVLLAINKKRGYKSSRKSDAGEEGQLIDGMQIAKELHTSGMTPAQYCQKALSQGKPAKFDFYRSDLEKEFNRIWDFQKEFYPDILTDDFKTQLERQGKNGTSKIFLGRYNIFTADNKGKDRRTTAIVWRVSALTQKLEPDVLAYVIADLRGEIAGSSGYLGEISDRSKELFFNDETVGQYLYRNISADPSFNSRNKVFYRQDYIDEFNRIWDVQSRFHPELTPSLKKDISETILFFQRPLKSQKGLISFCEFESHPIKVMVDGKEKTKMTGSRVAPRSSLLFQEFKIWQILNNLRIMDSLTGDERPLNEEEKTTLARELSLRAKIKQTELLKILGLGTRKFKLNYKEIEGNSTISVIFSKYMDIVNVSGHGEYDLEKLPYETVTSIVTEVFQLLGCKKDIFTFDAMLPKEEYEQQPIFKLWHLLYSYEGDKSNTGDESLITKISDLTGLDREYAKIIASISFKEDYASVSHKAIRKILPFLKEGYKYSDACALAGYNHSHSLTKEDLEKKELKPTLDLLPKGALRNPVVEKIINQMINVVNAAADVYGKPDEIHIELARELKQNAKDREKATNDIQANNRRNEEYEQILRTEFGLSSVTKSDILRYRLYKELEENGFKTLYSQKYISRSALFSKEIDIEHIIPQALLFDDSFSNKTLEFKDINREKSNKTANDFVKDKYGDDYYAQYRLRIDDLTNRGVISERKRKLLLMTQSDIPSGFIDRDLRDSQYIAKKSREILQDYVKVVVPTTGSVTKRLREEWQLVNVMKEINLAKYEKAGKTYLKEGSDGKWKPEIIDWTKRNDHRHHAIDAITIAFTKPEHIRILNHLNAKTDKDSAYYGLWQNNTTVTANNKRIFTPPMPLDELRHEVKTHLDATLVSIKAKNKVVTRNVNKIKTADGTRRKIELTPRGALHKEQVYGQRKRYDTYEVAVGAKMTAEVIATVASKRVREALQARLDSFGGDAKKAFTGKNSLEKNPLFWDSAHTKVVPSKVQCVRIQEFFSIRKKVDPNLSVNAVIDSTARSRIKERIEMFNGDIKAALSNLDENPIYLDAEKRIPIKRVAIRIDNCNYPAIRHKRGNDGKQVYSADGIPIPSDFVDLQNNHHVALYLDEKGVIQEDLVPFFKALDKKAHGYPIIDKSKNAYLGWRFLYSLKINEMFVFPDETTGFFPEDIDLLDPKNTSVISPHLFRVQKLSSKYYVFRHHLETYGSDYDYALRDITWKRVTNIQLMEHVVKVRIDHLGRIVAVGEYD